jgi:hypothetical protein
MRRIIDIWQDEREKAEQIADLKILRETQAVNDRSRNYAKIWYGKTIKPRYFYSFSTLEQRENWLKEEIERAQRRVSEKEKEAKLLQEVKDNFKNPFSIGDILYCSWGYDQTNVEFFQIVETRKKSVTFREIRSKRVDGTEGHMCCDVMADKDNFTGKPTKRALNIRAFNGKITYSINYAEYKGGYMRHLSKWDGNQKYNSWYA